MLIRPLPEDALSLFERLVITGAPTSQEQLRAEFIANWLTGVGAASVEIDEDSSVVVRLGPMDQRAILFDAHLDTVSKVPVPLLRKEYGRWHCEGAQDNTASCLLLMLLVRELLAAPLHVPLMLTWTSGEEGFGNLRGIRGILKRHGSQIREAFVFDLSQTSLAQTAVGSERQMFRWSGAGGHSWKEFGVSSAIEAMADWVARLRCLAPWAPGVLTYNVGGVSGGSGINVIAPAAEAMIEIRSPNGALMADAFEAVHRAAQSVAGEHGLKVSWETLGSRPAGSVDPEWQGIRIIQAIHHECGIPLVEEIVGTNANALLAAGIPALCTGLTLGGRTHSSEEWIDLASLNLGWVKLQKIAARLGWQLY